MVYFVIGQIFIHSYYHILVLTVIYFLVTEITDTINYVYYAV